MADDAWRAKWGSVTREEAEAWVENCRQSRAAQEACNHHWHGSGTVIRQAIAGGATSERIYCCHCNAWATRHQRYEKHIPEGCGKWYNGYRALPPTYDIEYITVPTIDP